MKNPRRSRWLIVAVVLAMLTLASFILAETCGEYLTSLTGVSAAELNKAEADLSIAYKRSQQMNELLSESWTNYEEVFERAKKVLGSDFPAAFEFRRPLSTLIYHNNPAPVPFRELQKKKILKLTREALTVQNERAGELEKLLVQAARKILDVSAFTRPESIDRAYEQLRSQYVPHPCKQMGKESSFCLCMLSRAAWAHRLLRALAEGVNMPEALQVAQVAAEKIGGKPGVSEEEPSSEEEDVVIEEFRPTGAIQVAVSEETRRGLEEARLRGKKEREEERLKEKYIADHTVREKRELEKIKSTPPTSWFDVNPRGQRIYRAEEALKAAQQRVEAAWPAYKRQQEHLAEREKIAALESAKEAVAHVAKRRGAIDKEEMESWTALQKREAEERVRTKERESIHRDVEAMRERMDADSLHRQQEAAHEKAVRQTDFNSRLLSMAAVAGSDDARSLELLFRQEAQLGTGIDVNVHDNDGNTPLHKTAAFGATARSDKAETLLKYGAQKNATNKRGETPLLVAARAGTYRLIPLLIDTTTINKPDNTGNTPLHEAAKVEDKFNSQVYERIVQDLLVAGADLTAVDADGRTPLHRAAQQCEPKVVAHLMKGLKHLRTEERQERSEQLEGLTGSERAQHLAKMVPPADMNKCDKYGRTALDLVPSQCPSWVGELLEEFGAERGGRVCPHG